MTALTSAPHHAGAWGPVGSFIAELCCLGVVPVLAALAAVGLGFVVNDLILVPPLVLFLSVTLYARAAHVRIRDGSVR